MSQEQPKSLPHYRTLSVELGCDRALKAASQDVDSLLDQLGRKTDRHLTIMFCASGWGFVFGVFVGWLL